MMMLLPALWTALGEVSLDGDILSVDDGVQLSSGPDIFGLRYTIS